MTNLTSQYLSSDASVVMYSPLNPLTPGCNVEGSKNITRVMERTGCHHELTHKVYLLILTLPLPLMSTLVEKFA